jgi:hypothetical protein
MIEFAISGKSHTGASPQKTDTDHRRSPANPPAISGLLFGDLTFLAEQAQHRGAGRL